MRTFFAVLLLPFHFVVRFIFILHLLLRFHLDAFFISVGRFDEPLFQYKSFSVDKNLALLEWRCVQMFLCMCFTRYNFVYMASIFIILCAFAKHTTTKCDDDDDDASTSKLFAIQLLFVRATCDSQKTERKNHTFSTVYNYGFGIGVDGQEMRFIMYSIYSCVHFSMYISTHLSISQLQNVFYILVAFFALSYLFLFLVPSLSFALFSLSHSLSFFFLLSSSFIRSFCLILSLCSSAFRPLSIFLALNIQTIDSVSACWKTLFDSQL